MIAKADDFRSVLKRLLEEAYLTGFASSSEGFNGEWPFDDDPAVVFADQEMCETAEEYAESVLNRPLKDVWEKRERS